MKISEEILDRINNVRVRIAEAIHDGDWSALGWNVALVLAVALVAIALAVAVLALVGKVLGTLLGKVLAVPLVLFILGLSYKMNFEDSRKAIRAKNQSVTLDEWADNIYEYMRDATFLVLREVSEYTANIIMPSSASAIELPENRYTVEDGYVIFHFCNRICGPVDTDQLKIDVQRTFRQKHRAHALNGFSRDLTEINGSYYCPLQIFGKPQDFGDCVQVSVVLATEKTVELTRAHKVLNLDNIVRTRKSQGTKFTDDEL